MSQLKDPWFAQSGRCTARLRLFCFPYAGGGSTIYHGWDRDLPDEVDVRALRLPGREMRIREVAFREVGPMVEATLEGIRPYLDVPAFALLGYSMGALLAYELAIALRRAGGPEPAHLFILARRAPSRPEPPAISHLPEQEFIDQLEQRYGMANEALDHPELRQLILPTVRADCAVCETYEYAPSEPLSMPITAIGGREDPTVSRDDLEAWAEHCTASCEVVMVDGHHFFLETMRDEVLAAVRRPLADILTS